MQAYTRGGGRDQPAMEVPTPHAGLHPSGHHTARYHRVLTARGGRRTREGGARGEATRAPRQGCACPARPLQPGARGASPWRVRGGRPPRVSGLAQCLSLRRGGAGQVRGARATAWGARRARRGRPRPPRWCPTPPGTDVRRACPARREAPEAWGCGPAGGRGGRPAGRHGAARCQHLPNKGVQATANSLRSYVAAAIGGA